MNLHEWLNYSTHHPGHWHRQCLLLQCSAEQLAATQAELGQWLCDSGPVALLGESPATQPTENGQGWLPAGAVSYPLGQYRQVLGQEFAIGIYHGFAGFRPNALLALAGTIQRAGRLIILCPPLAQWPSHPGVTQPHFLSHGYQLSHSPFLAQFVSQLIAHPATAVAHSDDLAAARLPVVSAKPEHTVPLAPFKTHDQLRAFTQLCQNALHMPQVFLTSPRGRGKSTLMALLAAHLISVGRKPYLTSSLQQSQQVFYSMLADALETSQGQAKQAVPWVAPDNPRLTAGSVDILLIDEAASLPLPVLSAISATQQHCVMSSTVLGFEGSGKGFAYKFMQPALRAGRAIQVELQTPVRWFNDDPLEQVCNRTLLQETGEATPAMTINGIDISRYTSDALSAQQLSAVLNLLSMAHYQTTPDDMMRLVDSPDCSLFVSWQAEQPVAAAIINHEGGQRLAEVAPAIARGARRVKGHLSAQSVSFISATQDYATHQYWRINRIAVHPALQRCGLGRELLCKVVAAAKHDQADWLSTSFAYDAGVASFWQQAGFTQLRHGSKADKASGQPSLLMLLPLSRQASCTQPILQRLADFDACSHSQLPSQVDPFLATILRSRLDAYCDEARHSQSLGNTLYYAVQAAAAAREHLPGLLQDKYLQRITNHELLQKHKLKGKAALERAHVQACQEAYGLLVKFLHQ